MVSFCPRWWLVAAGPAASAVARGEGSALFTVEETFVSSDVEGLPGLTEQDSEVAGVAEVPVDRLRGHRSGVALEVAEG